MQSVLPRGYLEAEFLESTGGQRIETGVMFASDTTLEMEACQTVEGVSPGFFGTENYNHANVGTARFNCLLLGNTTRWDYGSSQYNSGTYINVGVWYKIKKAAENNYVDGVLVCKNGVYEFEGIADYIFTRGLRSIWNDGGMAARIKYVRQHKGEVLVRDFISAITDAGAPCFFDKVTKQAFLNKGGGAFIVGMTLEQARKLGKLPSGGGTLTVSLPWEAQLLITGVPDALQAAADKGWTLTVQYREPEEDSELYNKYAACTTVEEVQAVNADYKNDLTADGEWVYPLPELVYGSQLFQNAKNLKKINMTFPKLEKGNVMFTASGLKEMDVICPVVKIVQQWTNLTGVKKIKAILPLCTSADSLFYGNNCEEIYADIPSMTWMPYAFLGSTKKIISSHKSLAITGNQAGSIVSGSFEEFPWELPNLKSGEGLLSSARLNLESALRVLNSLPTYTSGSHPLGIGIHVDHQTDEELLTAIADAEAKGWTLAVRWNGTATAQAASTFGLRRQPIYAKLGTLERPDGTTEQVLDWGHYVTEWEANGYQEFASVEEAEEYFNIGG